MPVNHPENPFITPKKKLGFLVKYVFSHRKVYEFIGCNAV